MSKQTDFINKVGPIVRRVCIERGYGSAQVWTCISQACLETGYGTTSLMNNANAFFGIKATSVWIKKAKYGGKVFSSKTKECYDGKTFVDITDTFRAYDSLEDSIRDYFDLLEGARYKSSLTKNTVKDCITAIKNGGYATDPKYIDKIVNIYNSNRSLIEVYGVNQSKYFSRYSGNTDSLVMILDTLNVDSSPAYRAKIAEANGIKNYKLTADQNLKLVALLKEGTCKRP